MPDYTLYDVTITVATPLHIGSGRELLLNYDYCVHGGRTWRINEDALLDAQDVADAKLAARLAEIAPGQLLEGDDFKEDSRLFRYVLNGSPRSQDDGARLTEQLKDAWDRPYIPGSSLKGALRTALAWHAAGANGLRVTRDKLKTSAKWAAQDLERELFGRDPNHDLLRALEVADSEPAGPERLMLVNAQVVGRRQAGSPIELEAIRPGTTFRTRVKVDDALFSPWAGRLGWSDKADWLARLPAHVQSFSAQRMQAELKWWQGSPLDRGVAPFYGELSGASLGASACLLQLGWGGGWDSKTLGSRLRADERLMAGIIDQYRLRRGAGRGGPGRSDAPFPASRRAAMKVGKDSQGRRYEAPVAPMGWVVLEFKRGR